MNLVTDVTELLSVELGPGRSGLVGQIGFAIYENDGVTIKENRTTASVFEMATALGTYGVRKTFSSSNYATTWTGFLVWDTGESDATKRTVVTQKISTRRTTIAAVADGGGGGSSSASWVHD